MFTLSYLTTRRSLLAQRAGIVPHWASILCQDDQCLRDLLQHLQDAGLAGFVIESH